MLPHMHMSANASFFFSPHVVWILNPGLMTSFNLCDSQSIHILSSELLEISNIVLQSLNVVLAVPELGT